MTANAEVIQRVNGSAEGVQGSVAADRVRVLRGVQAQHRGGRREVAFVMDGLGGGVVVVVAAVAVRAEAVEMLHPEVQALGQAEGEDGNRTAPLCRFA